MLIFRLSEMGSFIEGARDVALLERVRYDDSRR